MLDRYDTPPAIAAALVRAVTAVQPKVVADFAAGGGVLLAAAERRWHSATVVASDVDVSTAKKLRRIGPYWHVAAVDFMNARSRAASPVLRTIRGRTSVILLNPPYSCRGARCISVASDRRVFECAPALAFVVEALTYLAPDGELVAVLPAGSLSSNKDASVWEYLRRRYDVTVVERLGPRAFAGCVVRTAIVRIGPRRHRLLHCVSTTPAVVATSDITLRRGQLPMHQVRRTSRSRGVELVHTSHLHAGQVERSGIFVSRKSALSGPAVLIPRVGAPIRGKIALLHGPCEVALSDCVIAVSATAIPDIAVLRAAILERWQELADSYGGTCAPYITLSRLRSFVANVVAGIHTRNALAEHSAMCG